MKIHQYFNVLAVMVTILFLAAASIPTTSFAVTWNCQPTKAKAVKAKAAKSAPIRYARVSNGGYKRQSARNQSNTVQKPICVQCSIGYAPNWGTVAASGSGTRQQNNPPVICSTCVPAWSLPATAARAPATTARANQTGASGPVCSTCLTCADYQVNCAWNTPATAGTSATYTPPPPAPPTTTNARVWNGCGGLLCSILQVPYNIGAFVFGGRPMGGCS